MKDLKLFTQSELSTLETLDIMGGTIYFLKYVQI